MTKKASTPAVKSKTIWGGLISWLPIITIAIDQLGTNPLIQMSPKAMAIIAAVGGVLTIIGRIQPEIKPIKGAFVQQ